MHEEWNVGSKRLTLTWRPALALEGGGWIDHYEISVDAGEVRALRGNYTLGVTVDLAAAPQSQCKRTWRVRAVNSLGNCGGWSLTSSFSACDTRMHV